MFNGDYSILNKKDNIIEISEEKIYVLIVFTN